MSNELRAFSLPVPGVRALRVSGDDLHSGMKEMYSIGHVEAGRSEWWSGGKVWRLGPGSLQLLQPGDVYRDISRDGPGAVQIISLSPSMVEPVTGKIRVRPRVDADDPSGAPFRRLHDAVRGGADRFELEVAVAEAIAAFGAFGDA